MKCSHLLVIRKTSSEFGWRWTTETREIVGVYSITVVDKIG